MAGQSLKYKIQEDQGALCGEEGGERYDGVAGLRMGWKPGYPCDGQAEGQVSMPVCARPVRGPVFSGKPM